jgi:isochorismate pyruvate lyase
MAAAAGGVAATAVDGKPMNDPVCASLDEVRENIDRLDCALVPLLLERGGYVRAAAAFKTDAGHVAAPDRVERVVAHVRALASQAGGNPDFIETLYRAMIATYIADELRLWETRRG